MSPVPDLRAYGFLGCLLLAGGCGGDEAASAREATLATVWGVPSAPLLTVGDESSEAQTFQRITGVHMDSADRILVVDGGAAEIRIFGPDGAHEETWGGKGDGPGEYRSPALLGVMAGDTVVVLDRQDHVVDVRSPAGEIDRSFRFLDAGDPTPKQALAVLSDGRVVYQVVSLFGGVLEEGVVLTDTIRLAWMASQEEAAVPLGTGPVPKWVWTREEQVPMPFAPQFSVSVRGDSVFTLDAAATHVRVLRPGQAPTTWVTPREPTPVTRGDREAYESAVRARGFGAQLTVLWLSALDHPELPKSKPVYDRVLATDDGEVWARLAYGSMGVWDVYSSQGSVRGTVVLPLAATPYQVTGDRIAAVVRDSMGVQTVAVFAKQAVRDSARIAAALDEVRAELEGLADLEEIFFADSYTYTARLEALHRKLPVTYPDVSLVITAAGPEGWAASATHTALAPGEGCRLVRPQRPAPSPEPGWAVVDGEVVCSVGAGPR